MESQSACSTFKTLNALDALNRKVVNGKPLAEYLARDGFSYLIPLQGPLFLRLTRGAGLSGPTGRARARSVKGFLVIATLIGLVQMLLQRPRVVVYANDLMTDNESYDPRMGAIYRWLLSRGGFGNIIHATPQNETLRRWMRRLGPVVYYEAFEAIARLLLRIGILKPTFAVPQDADALLEWTIRQANNTAATVPLLRWALGIMRPRQLWLMDDARYWHQLVISAKGLGIRTVLFQHGRFNKHLPTVTYTHIPSQLVPTPDRYVVWSEYWKRRLIAVSPPFTNNPSVIRVGGQPSRIASQSTLRRGGRVVVVIFEPGHDKTWYRSFIEQLTRIESFTFALKVRANVSEADQLQAYNLEGLVADGKLHVIREMPNETALVVGAYSTMLYEMVQAGIPVGVLATRDTQAEDLVEEGLAASIDPARQNLTDQIERASMASQEELMRRSQLLKPMTNIELTLEYEFSK